MAELRRRVRFSHDAVVDVGRPLDDLDGDRPPHLEVVGQVDGRERPAAELADVAIAVVKEGRLCHVLSISGADEQASAVPP